MSTALAALARINTEPTNTLVDGEWVQVPLYKVSAVKEGQPITVGMFLSEDEANEAVLAYNEENVPGWRALRTPGLRMGPGGENNT